MINESTNTINDIHISITRREQEVFDMVCKGYTTKEIANLLYVSEHTIVSHKKRLKQKFGAKNTAQMVSTILRKLFILFACLLSFHSDGQISHKFPLSFTYVNNNVQTSISINQRDYALSAITQLNDAFYGAGIEFELHNVSHFYIAKTDDSYLPDDVSGVILSNNNPDLINIYIFDGDLCYLSNGTARCTLKGAASFPDQINPT